MQPVILDSLPDGLLEKQASELHHALPGPCLIHIPGHEPAPVFVSVLQHGNEDTGWEAVRRLLKSRYRRDPLPRSLMLFIGNVEAARWRMRHLGSQPDFNRCWPGSRLPDMPWRQMFRAITDHARAHTPVASIDIHNNTGMNPHYAAVNSLDPGALHLAAHFSRTVIYFTEPSGVQSMAFGEFCPAVTLECGQAGDTHGIDHAMSFLESVLRLEPPLPDTRPDEQALSLYHMTATVNLADGMDFGFEPDGRDLRFVPHLDHYNFRELPAGTPLARTSGEYARPLRVTDHDGRDVTDEYIRIARGEVHTRRQVMPSMLTHDLNIIRSDCLCYFMERVDTSPRPATAPAPDAPAELPESDELA